MTTSILTDAEIRALSQGDNPLVSEAPDFNLQLQPAGFDVTTRRVTRLGGVSRIGGPYRSRVAEEDEVEESDGWCLLDTGAYLIHLNEFTRLPQNVVAFAYPRSTLFRCGASLSSGVWDSGFEGRGRLGLHVAGVTQLEIELHAPIAQLVFHRTNGSENGFGFNEFYVER